MSGGRGNPSKVKTKVLAAFDKQQESGNTRRILTNVFVPKSADISVVEKRVKAKYKALGWQISQVRVVRGKFFNMAETSDAAA